MSQTAPVLAQGGRFVSDPAQPDEGLLAPLWAPTQAALRPVEEWPAPVSHQRFELADRISALTGGRVQIEAGYVFTSDGGLGQRTMEHTLPDFLLRVGLSRRLELRLGWPGYVATLEDGPGGRQTTDRTLRPNVGLMLDLWPQRAWIPQTAVLGSVPITLEGDLLAMESLQPLSQLLYAWYLTGRLALGGTTGFSVFQHQGDHFLQFEQTASADWLLSDRLGAFVEWTVLVDHGSAEDGSEHLLGGGLSLLGTDRFQVSWRAGVGLNERAPDFVTGVRCAVRF
ncbi:MAG: transporter [Thermoguttaceae bacterium]